MRARIAIASAVAVAGLALGGCGEKQEPDLSKLPAPPQPAPPKPPKGLPAAVEGHWHGTLTQKGIKPFSIDVKIVSADDPSRNVVRYGGQIDCAGTWTYLDADGPRVRFRERIDRGAGGRCKGSGQVTVQPENGDRLKYSFSGGGVQSGGVLKPAG